MSANRGDLRVVEGHVRGVHVHGEHVALERHKVDVLVVHLLHEMRRATARLRVEWSAKLARGAQLQSDAVRRAGETRKTLRGAYGLLCQFIEIGLSERGGEVEIEGLVELRRDVGADAADVVSRGSAKVNGRRLRHRLTIRV